MRRVRVQIFGKVQSVAFRSSAKRKAEELGIAGWIKNSRDDFNLIEGIFQGENEAVEKMLEWCANGPERATVFELKVFEEKPDENFSGFEVRFD